MRNMTLMNATFFLAVLLAAPHANAQGSVNVALGKPVMPLTETAAGEPEWVVDGNVATAWWSYQGTTSEAECVVDLGSTHLLNQLVLRVIQAENYAISASLDGGNWTALDQGSATFPIHPAITVDLPEPVPARYLRFHSGNSQSAYAGLIELEAYSDTVFMNGFE